MYLNKDKFERASDVVNGKRNFDSTSVEVVAKNLGIAEKLTGDKLIDFVYSKLGGAKSEDPKKEPLQAGIIKEEVSGKEVEEVGKKGKKRTKVNK